MLSKDMWPVAQFSRLSFDTTCLYVFAENKLISNVKKVSFFWNTLHLRSLCSNFVQFESFLESSSPDILAVCVANLDDSNVSGNFSVRGYLALI